MNFTIAYMTSQNKSLRFVSISLPFILRTRCRRFPQFHAAHFQPRVFQTVVHFDRHIFGSGATGQAQGFHVPALQEHGDLAFAAVAAIVDKRMIERVGNVFFHNGFEVGEIHHHAVFRATPYGFV